MKVGLSCAAIIGALAVALQASPAVAKVEVETLAPSSNWVVDYADDSCGLRRTFGEGDDRTWLELRQFSPSDEFVVTFATPKLVIEDVVPKSQFGPDGPMRKQLLAAYRSYDVNMKAVSFPDSLRETADDEERQHSDWTAQERSAREAAVKSYYIQDGPDRAFLLQTGSLEKPMQAVRTCFDDLLKSWGVDPTVNQTLSRPPAPKNPESYVPEIQRRFPVGLLLMGGRFKVTVGLLIDADGNLEACRITRPVVDKGYEKDICGLFMEKAKFLPARDANGSPVRSYDLTDIIYVQERNTRCELETVSSKGCSI